jgi:hypothetical protein
MSIRAHAPVGRTHGAFRVWAPSDARVGGTSTPFAATIATA